jgi:hypothetical protein
MLIFSLLASIALSEDLSLSETSYSGATILEGDSDVIFEDTVNLNGDSEPNAYSFFEGNTLYVGNSDDYGNSIDGIVEFFWFQSSIDRGTDFYVAVIKSRVSPGDNCYVAPWVDGYDCHLWADETQDWGEYPVLSVEALTDVSREAGAFRWDWSVPFENYGIDAYGQVTFQNQYGIGANAEGSAMAHGEYTLDEDGAVKAAGDVQVKGYVSSLYSVQTQYEVTLYEWDVFVDGRANMMAWDMYLNLGARDDQSAYHEYFLAIQVEEGETFMLDSLTFSGHFDTGWWNPISHPLGLTLTNLQIMPPVYIPVEDPVEDSDTGEPAVEEDTAAYTTEEYNDTGDNNDEELSLNEREGETIKSCASTETKISLLSMALTIMIMLTRRR